MTFESCDKFHRKCCGFQADKNIAQLLCCLCYLREGIFSNLSEFICRNLYYCTRTHKLNERWILGFTKGRTYIWLVNSSWFPECFWLQSERFSPKLMEVLQVLTMNLLIAYFLFLESPYQLTWDMCWSADISEIL